MGNLIHDRRGQAAVEFALVIPVFLLLMVGIFEASRAWNIYHALADAARQGARAASLANPAITEDSVRRSIQRALRGSALDPTVATITVSGVSAPSGGMTSVQLQYPYQMALLYRLSRGGAGGGLNLSASTVMRHE